MRAAFGDVGVVAVVYGEEDVGNLFEGGECGGKGERVGSLGQHEAHAGSEEDDVGGWRLGEKLVFEVSAGVRLR